MESHYDDFARFDVNPITVKRLRVLGLGDDEIRCLFDIMRSNFKDCDREALTQCVSSLMKTIARRYHSMRTRSLYQWKRNPELTRLSMIRLYIAQKGKCYHNPAITMTFLDVDDVFGKNHMLSTERVTQHEPYTLRNTVFCCMQYQTRKQATVFVLKELITGVGIEANISQLTKDNWKQSNAAKMFAKLLENISARCTEKRRRRYMQKLKALRYWRKEFPLNNSSSCDVEFDSEVDFQSIGREIALEEDDYDEGINNGQSEVVGATNDKDNPDEVGQLDRVANGRKSMPRCFLTKYFLRDCFNRQKGRCYYSGHPLTLETGSAFSASIERIDNDGDHTEENCVLVCSIMQAPFVKWTSELFLKDHSHWRDRIVEFEKECEIMKKNHGCYVESKPLENKCEIAFYPNVSGPIPPDDSYRILRVVHVSGDTVCQFCSLQLSSIKALGAHKRQLHPMTLLTCPVPSCRHVHNQEYKRDDEESDGKNKKEEKKNSDQYIFDKVYRLLNHYVEKHAATNGKLACPIQGCTAGPFEKAGLCRHLSKTPKPETDKSGKKKTAKQLARDKSHTEEEKYRTAERLYVENGTRHAFTPLDRGRKIHRNRTTTKPASNIKRKNSETLETDVSKIDVSETKRKRYVRSQREEKCKRTKIQQQ